MQSEFVEIIEATQATPQAINPIARVLEGKKGSPLEHLVKSCHCTLNKKRGYITDVAGKIIHVSQLFQYHGYVTTGETRCPKCKEGVSWDLILFHFEDHGLKIEKVCQLFKRNFDQWSYNDSRFSYMGEPISYETL